MKDKRGNEKGAGGRLILITVFTCALVYVMALIGHAGREEIIRNVAFALAGSMMMSYLILAENAAGKENTRLSSHPGFFLASYPVCLVLAALFSLTDPMLWPFAAVYLLLFFAGGEIVALFCGSFLLVLSVLMGEGDYSAVLVYFVTGLFIITLYRGYGRETRAVTVLVPALLLQALLTNVFVLLSRHTEGSPALFVRPGINLVFTAFLLVTVMHLNNSVFSTRDRDRYLEINDPEFSLMSAIKSKNEAEYFRAIHTAYLAERIAAALGLHAQAAKTCAYYSRIGCLDEEESTWETVSHYFTEFDFPPESQRILQEYMRMGEGGPKSGEATIVWMCDTLVMSLQYVFHKNKDARVNYDEMIDRLFSHKAEGNELAKSGLTLAEFRRMRELLKQEKLYYDFLR